jgi:acetyl-CoA acetyltransferase
MGKGKAIPVIIGVGEVRNASKSLEDSREPADLMLQAIQNAVADCQTSHPILVKRLHSSIDSINVVATWTWSYPDLPGLLYDRLGVPQRHKRYSPHGGNSPAVLLDDAARRIAAGESKIAIVTGGEALASCRS